MSDLNEFKDLKELIDSFVAYRNVLVPLQESLKTIGDTYESIKADLESISKSFSGNMTSQLDRIHSTLSAQAKSGQEFSRKLDEYASAAERYTQAVNEMTRRFNEVAKRVETVTEIEKGAESLISRLDTLISEKHASYNLKDLQRSLDNYGRNIERISDFINKDVASVLKSNADKIESIKKGNDELSAMVSGQSKSVAELTAEYAETSALLKKAVEGGAVNEEYLFDAFDKWAADRKVKIKKK